MDAKNARHLRDLSSSTGGAGRWALIRVVDRGSRDAIVVLLRGTYPSAIKIAK